MKVLKLCSNCYNNITDEEIAQNPMKAYNGDFKYVGEYCDKCPDCGSELRTCPIDEIDRLTIAKISNYDRKAFEDMCNLKLESPAEYALKISRFKTSYITKTSARDQIQPQQPTGGVTTDNTAYEQQHNYKTKYVPKCPTCGCPYVEKIEFSTKIGWGILIGLFSNNIRRTFHCTNCDYRW